MFSHRNLNTIMIFTFLFLKNENVFATKCYSRPRTKNFCQFLLLIVTNEDFCYFITYANWKKIYLLAQELKDIDNDDIKKLI